MKKIIIPLLITILTFSSCKSTKNIAKNDGLAKKQDVKQVLQKINNNTIQYNGLEINKANCSLETENTKISFKASILSQYNEFIDITIVKLLPIARAMLTPDNITVINNLKRGYYQGSYDLIQEMIGIKLEYKQMQDVITGTLPILKKSKLKYSDFECYMSDNTYILRLIEPISFNMQGSALKNTQPMQVNASIHVDAKSYKIKKIQLVDYNQAKELVINYPEYINVEGKEFPKEIQLRLDDRGKVSTAKITMDKITLKNKVESNFKISDKYKKLN